MRYYFLLGWTIVAILFITIATYLQDSVFTGVGTIAWLLGMLVIFLYGMYEIKKEYE